MFESQDKCIALLEHLRWSSQPKCPYCSSKKSSKIKQEQRYHCNSCYTSYSVTVGTIFHRTHVKLPQWFQAIELVMHRSPDISARKLASEIGVSKKTAATMLNRIRRAAGAEKPSFLELLLQAISEVRKRIDYSTPDMISKEN